jgi:hypothetical protein
MPMTAAECRARAQECMDLAEVADATGREQLFKMAATWLQMAETATERQSEAVRISVAGRKQV